MKREDDVVYECFSSLLQVINMNYTVVIDSINYSTEAIQYMFFFNQWLKMENVFVVCIYIYIYIYIHWLYNHNQLRFIIKPYLTINEIFIKNIIGEQIIVFLSSSVFIS